jgi:hypothetical protein
MIGGVRSSSIFHFVVHAVGPLGEQRRLAGRGRDAQLPGRCTGPVASRVATGGNDETLWSTVALPGGALVTGEIGDPLSTMIDT